MARPTLDEYFSAMADLVSTRGTCARRKVGCVLVDARGVVLSTGYNGSPAGFVHCVDVECPGASLTSGYGLDMCRAIHAEQNALLFCRDPGAVNACYSTTAPCPTCAKMLLNTPCRRVIFHDPYPGPAEEMWRSAGREWVYFDIGRSSEKNTS